MQVEAAGALAPVLARFAIVVDGPLEAEVVGRLAVGEPATLADLARPFPGRPDLSRADAVGVARAVVTRLLASGAVEPAAGGYRIADPSLATALRQVVASVEVARAATAARPPSPTTVVALPAPVAPEDASRLLQQALGARALPSAAAAPTVGGGTQPAPASTHAAVPTAVAGLTTVLGEGGTTGGVLVRLVVANPESPVAATAARLGARGPVALTHLPAPALRWGQLDPMMARASADGLLATLASQPAGTAAPVVADRGMVPALALLAGERALPSVLVVDLRTATGPSTASRVGPFPSGAAPPAPHGAAAAMAGAAGTPAPPRRSSSPPGRVRDRRTLLEVLFGPQAAESLAEDDRLDPDGRPDHRREGVVVTARIDDPQADALAELLGVEVQVLRPHDDLGDEVLAWLEDDEGQRLLPPRA